MDPIEAMLFICMGLPLLVILLAIDSSMP